ncbi:MAG: DUF4430 domain-containing protein [Methanomassiliicoccales archaeon]|jgi:hypothetical protein|nr:DUF4430 domain-containing protein [Methanomassiliicoccales archaeon]
MENRFILKGVVIAAIAAILLFSGCLSDGGSTEKITATLVIDFNGPEGTIQPGNLTIWDKANGQWMIVDSKENNGRTVWVFKNISNVSNVLELTQKAAQIGEFTLDIRYYLGMGNFIEAIAGVKNERPGRGWQYWVNGEYATKACDQWRLNNGDIVEWRFAEPSW